MLHTLKSQSEKPFIEEFEKLCRTRSSWSVWADFVTTTACALSNSIGKGAVNFDKREKEYAECIERLGGVEAPAKMFASIVNALELNPEQDFLGDMFMRLGLGNHWKGQFFTPYHVCKLMAEVNCESLGEQIEEKGWVSVNDCACGAGATLIAMANTMRNKDINYQNHALFVAQDIDRVAALMCYIQLSLLGCAGYVVVGDSICNPLTGHPLFPRVNSNHELWTTPMFNNDVWSMRRLFNTFDLINKENR